MIHASDNESQVDHMLKLLGHREGLDMLRHCPNPILHAPYFVPHFDHFVLREIDLDSLRGQIILSRFGPDHLRETRIEETPQYACLQGDLVAYQSYLDRWLGTILTQDYAVECLLDMARDFIYLEPPTRWSTSGKPGSRRNPYDPGWSAPRLHSGVSGHPALSRSGAIMTRSSVYPIPRLDLDRFFYHLRDQVYVIIKPAPGFPQVSSR